MTLRELLVITIEFRNDDVADAARALAAATKAAVVAVAAATFGRMKVHPFLQKRVM